MKTLRNIFWVFFLIQSVSIAQTPDYQSIPYKFGKFEGQLPSGKKFYITGPLINMDKPPGDVVILNIYKLGRKSGIPETCPHYSGYYWRAADDNSTDFKIFVDIPLLFSRSYKFEFEYFSSAQYTAGKNILTAFVQKLDTHFSNKKSLNEFDLINMLEAVTSDLKEKDFGSLDFVQNSNCNNYSFQFVDKMEAVTFPIKTQKGEVTSAELAGFITDNYLIKKETADIATAQLNIKNGLDHSDVKDAFSAFSKFLTENSSSAKYSQKNIDELKSFLSSESTSSSPVPNFDPLFSNQTILNETQKNKLFDLIATRITLTQESEQLEKNQAKVVLTEAKLGSFEDIILKGFTLSGTSISYNKIEFEQPVQTTATNATTPAGISGVLLNPQAKMGPSETDAFGNAAVRTYFYQVDKRMPGKQAYVDWGQPFNRMSATFGISVSPIDYRGETLEPAVGVKPIFALGYDISRSFGIDIGGILFRQDSPSLFNQNSTLRFAPIVSIQFDSNLFNRFKALGSGESYQLGVQ